MKAGPGSGTESLHGPVGNEPFRVVLRTHYCSPRYNGPHAECDISSCWASFPSKEYCRAIQSIYSHKVSVVKECASGAEMNSQIDPKRENHEDENSGHTEFAKGHGVSKVHPAPSRNQNDARRLQILRNLSGLRIVKVLCLGLAAACLVGVFVYWWMVVPLEKKLAARGAHSLAERVDAAIKVRIEVIRAATADLRVANLSAPGALDGIGQTLRQSFSDFISLEIVNEDGDLLAMVGDITLSEGARETIPALAGGNDNAKQGLHSIFHDDSKGRSFFVEVRHQGTDGIPWFTRARFSRDIIERLLNTSKGPLHATLVTAPVTGSVITGLDRDSANMSMDWLGNLAWIEAPLSVPGWWLRMESVPRQSIVSRLSLKTVALISLIVTVAVFVLRWNSSSIRRVVGKASRSHASMGKEARLHATQAVLAPEVGQSVPACHDPFNRPFVRDSSDDFFSNSTAEEILTTHASRFESKRLFQNDPSTSGVEGDPLHKVFASPEFLREFSEVPDSPQCEPELRNRVSETAPPENGSHSPDVGPIALTESSSSEVSSITVKDTHEASLKETETPPRPEMIWAEPVESRPAENPSCPRSPAPEVEAVNPDTDLTIPDCLEVEWIEPGEDATSRPSFLCADPHRTG